MSDNDGKIVYLDDDVSLRMVVDLGGATVKAGWAGDDCPRSDERCIVETATFGTMRKYRLQSVMRQTVNTSGFA